MAESKEDVGNSASAANGKRASNASKDVVESKPTETQSKRKSMFAGIINLKTVKKKAPVFVDAKQMKAEAKENLKVERYDVTNFYYTEGYCQEVARASWFENLTLAVIALNALWISIDTDYNNSEVLNDADAIFILMENFFCIYFVFEWIMRFGAFKNKLNCLRDAWMIFDTFMVVMMVIETWIMFIMFAAIGGGGGGLGNAKSASIVRLLRLLRLTRMARMAKLLRSMPELLILIKGMVAAVRSVFFTLVLLFLLMYVFAIYFRQMADGEIGKRHFPTTIGAIHTMVAYGTLCDSIGVISFGFAEQYEKTGDHWTAGVPLITAWYMFVLLSAILLMNMLIGVMCEVICAVASTEKEEIEIGFMKENLHAMFGKYVHHDPEHTKLDKDWFDSLIIDKDCRADFEDLGFAHDKLQAFKQSHFEDDDDPEKLRYALVDLYDALRDASIQSVPKYNGDVKTEWMRVVTTFCRINQDEIANITQDDFMIVFLQRETALVLADVDVDPFGLVDIVDTIFASDDGTQKMLSFNDLLTFMLDHRSSKEASVQDITDLRKYTRARATRLSDSLVALRAMEKDHRIKLQTQVAVLGDMLERVSGLSEGSFKAEADKLCATKTASRLAKNAAVGDSPQEDKE